jgi:hypothetical protein
MYVSEQAYMNYSREQLIEEQNNLSTALEAESSKQRDANAGDTISVILIGIPVASSTGGNRQSEIATLKGEIQAVQRAAKLKNYTLPPIPSPTTQSSGSKPNPTINQRWR